MNKDDLTLIIVCAFFSFAVGALSVSVKYYRCANYEQITGMKTKFAIFDGCYVQTKKGWFLKEQLRDIQAEKGDE